MSGTLISFGDYRLHREARQLAGPAGAVQLSDRALDILIALLARPGETVTKDQLLDAAWPGVAVEENTLHVHVSALRKALPPDTIATVHGRGYRYAGPPPVAVGSGGANARAARKPAIAVLPFDNLGGDPSQHYFSDGITDDIIDRLSRYRIVSVIGKHSSAALRGIAAAPGEAARRLTADYVVTGSVRRSADRIRIAARLTDAASEQTLWADHYDRPLQDLFAVQDDVANIAASTLVGRVEMEGGSRPPAAPGAVLSSYDLVLQGIAHFKKLTMAANAVAAEHFSRAIAIAPGNADAHRWLSSCHLNLWLESYDRPALAEGLRLAARAVELDPANAQCHSARAILQLWADGLPAAAQSYATAGALNPGDPNVLAELGLLKAYEGDLAASRDFFDRAFRLNPLPPPWYAEFRGVADFAAGDYAAAGPVFATIPDCSFDLMYAMACAGHMDDAAAARGCRRRFAARRRHCSLEEAARLEPFRDAAPRRRLAEGLARAAAL